MRRSPDVQIVCSGVEGAANMYSLNEVQAFDAMIAFLQQYYNATRQNEIYELILEIRYGSYDRSGHPVTSDPRSWGDWIRVVESIVPHEPARANDGG
jgi:hypothetical protein